MKHLLIPTDFSDNAWNALEYALFFFRRVRCRIYVVHAVKGRDSKDALAMGPILEAKAISPKEEMKEWVNRIERLPLNTKHQFEFILKPGNLIGTIRELVDEHGIDYIIMGTKGASGLKEMTIGSHTGDVITRVKCPTLVVPEDANPARIKEIAFPTDFNIGYKKRVLDTLLDVMHIGDSELQVVHVGNQEDNLSPTQQSNRIFLEEYLGEDTPFDYHFLTNDDLEQALQTFVESRDIRMIAMIAKNLNFFQRLLFRPVVKTIGYHTHVPFLVLHE